MPRRDSDREEDALWQLARARGLSRRRFLALLLAGGAASVLMACGDPIPERSAEAQMQAVRIFKDPAPFTRHGAAGLESRLELLGGEFLTPTERFFVRNNSRSLDIDADRWSLTVEGDAVRRPQQLSLELLNELTRVTVTAYLECAGNQRAMFKLLHGQAGKGTQWGRGAVGNADWTGVPLRDVLTLAELDADAVSVLLIGLDAESPEEGFRRVLPVDKAMHPDTLLAYTMNGEPLTKDHGYPLRAIAPGWVGASQIKWLDRIVVSKEARWTRNNTTSYVLIGDEYPAEGEATGQVVTVQSIKSALALPWPARLSAGTVTLQGFAHSGHGAIAQVEWSVDGGVSWQEALVGQQEDYSWAPFEFEWSATSGEYELMTRATDIKGNTQPATIPFNEKGYLFNQPLPHPISVSA